MESFFASLKKELVHHAKFAHAAEARAASSSTSRSFIMLNASLPRWGMSPRRSTNNRNNP